MTHNSVELLHKVANEFKQLDIPFHVEYVGNVQVHDSTRSLYNNLIVPEINIFFDIEGTVESGKFLNMSSVQQVTKVPTVDLTKIQDQTESYFKSDENNFKFCMSLDIEHKPIHQHRTKIALYEPDVKLFIEMFREAASDMIEKTYNKHFDDQVDEHLEIREDDGSK